MLSATLSAFCQIEPTFVGSRCCCDTLQGSVSTASSRLHSGPILTNTRVSIVLIVRALQFQGAVKLPSYHRECLQLLGENAAHVTLHLGKPRSRSSGQNSARTLRQIETNVARSDDTGTSSPAQHGPSCYQAEGRADGVASSTVQGCLKCQPQAVLLKSAIAQTSHSVSEQDHRDGGPLLPLCAQTI
jgi:hypothetical protein